MLNTKTPEPLLRDYKETAEMLQVSVATVRRMVADGILPVRKLRRRRLIPAEALRSVVAGKEF